MQIKLGLSVLFSVLCLCAFAQQKELEAFKQTIIQYNEYGAGKAAEAGHTKQSAEEYRTNIDKAFRKFVLLKNSENFEGFKTFEGGLKELTLDNQVTINITPFSLNGVEYAVYSFKSFIASDYYIKDNQANKILFHKDQRVPYVDAMYSIDKEHILIIEKSDDMNTGRRAFVASSSKKGWKQVDAFEGKELAYYEEEMVYKKERTYLNVGMSFEVYMAAPRNASHISFDTTTKTISYKTYENEKRPQTVSAQWKDNHFIIDDYDVGSHIIGFPTPVAP